MIGEWYWEGPNFELSQEAQNANLPIDDVVITRLTNFGSVRNVGHINTINIRVAEVTIEPQAIERVDQSLTMEHPNDVPLMHALNNLQVSNDELCGPQHSQHNINNMLYTTPTNDGDTSLSRIIPIES